MGRWTERAAARGFVNSAISAVSPPIGTNGTNGTGGPSEAEQVRFDEAAGALEYDHRQPRAVAEAVASLSVMRRPDSLSAERWRQLVADAGRFMSTRWAEAETAGWSVLDIFGVSPGFARRLDRDGLVSLLYGREVGAITADHIEILTGGDVLRFRKRGGAGAVPMWEGANV